jgi:hypothetical protein
VFSDDLGFGLVARLRLERVLLLGEDLARPGVNVGPVGLPFNTAGRNSAFCWSLVEHGIGTSLP